MPFNDLIQNHFDTVDITAVNDGLTAVEAAITAKCRNLSPEERQTYGSINEQNKLLVNKVRDYNNSQPNMSSPDVDWKEFDSDYKDREFIEATLLRIQTLVEMLNDTKILHDHDNYQNSLLDYKYAKYKADTDGAGGFNTKIDEIKQFFPNTGSTTAPTS